MSYTQITIGGKERGLKYNTMALIEYHKNINDGNEMSLLISAIWAGLMANHYAKKIEMDFTFEDVCDWCDEIENKPELMEKISRAMMETQIAKSIVSNSEKEEKKKH